MQDLHGILDQLLAEDPRDEMNQDERTARAAVMCALFESKGDGQNTEGQVQHLEATAEIPFTVLVLAVRGLIRAHPYKEVPRIADVWKAARYVAGMHRERHHEGRYLTVPTQWPPEGKRYAVPYGEYEKLPAVSIAALSDPKRAAKYLGAGT